MIRKILETLPFVHHRPPLSLPLRKAVIMSLTRPVSISNIEQYISGKYQLEPETVLENLYNGIEYLRRKRLLKRDASNLFVAGLRAVCKNDAAIGTKFGIDLIKNLPDERAIKTLITYLCRIGEHEEALKILNLSKNTDYKSEMKERILTILYPTKLEF